MRDPSSLKALEMATRLDQLNQERRSIQGDMESEALEAIELIDLHSTESLPYGMCLYQDNWHQGVVGVLASKIKEKTHRPVIAFAKENDEMLKKCSLAITIAGTTGLEAALYKKPCIIFADVNYSSLPSVYRLRSLEDLPNAIRESLKKEVKLSDVNDFINLLDRNSFPFDIFGFYSKMLERFHVGGFMISNEISMKSLDSFFEEDREIYEILAAEHIKKINQYKKLEKTIGPK